MYPPKAITAQNNEVLFIRKFEGMNIRSCNDTKLQIAIFRCYLSQKMK